MLNRSSNLLYQLNNLPDDLIKTVYEVKFETSLLSENGRTKHHHTDFSIPPEWSGNTALN
jgi:hypothetical protein